MVYIFFEAPSDDPSVAPTYIGCEPNDFIINETDLEIGIISFRGDISEAIFSLIVENGEQDEQYFIFNAENRKLSFQYLPDYENPTDLNGDNIYNLFVRATSVTGFNVDCLVTVQVNNVEGYPDCHGGQNNLVGNMTIEFNNIETTWIDAEESLQFQIDYHLAYSMVKINHIGDVDGVLDYSEDNTNGYIFIDLGNCIGALQKKISWEDLINSGTIFQLTTNDELEGTSLPTYSWFLNVTMSEVFVQYYKQRSIQTERFLTEALPLKLQFQNEVELGVNITTDVEETAIFDVIDGLVVSVPNLQGNAQVNISLKTIVTYPWEFDSNYFEITDYDDLIQDDMQEFLIERDKDCEIEFNADCTQNLIFSFTSNGVCNQRGQLDLELKLHYNGKERFYIINMTVQPGPASHVNCAVMLGTLESSGDIKLYTEESKWTNVETSIFYLYDTVYAEADVSNLAFIVDVNLTSLRFKQNGKFICNQCENIENLKVEILPDGPTSEHLKTCRFKFVLEDEIFMGGLDGDWLTTVYADLLVTFHDNTRRVLRMEKKIEPIDSKVLRTRKDFQIMKHPCEEGITFGTTNVENCRRKDGTRGVKIIQCTKDGWIIIEDQCDHISPIKKLSIGAASQKHKQATFPPQEEDDIVVQTKHATFFNSLIITTILCFLLTASLGICVQRFKQTK